MIVFVKYLILPGGLYAAFMGIEKDNLSAGIVAAGEAIKRIQNIQAELEILTNKKL